MGRSRGLGNKRGNSSYMRALEKDPEAYSTYLAVRRQYRKRIQDGEIVTCALCRRRITVLYDKSQPVAMKNRSLSIHHVIPIDMDNAFTLDSTNLVPSHRGCNRNVGRAIVRVWRPAPESHGESRY